MRPMIETLGRGSSQKPLHTMRGEYQDFSLLSKTLKSLQNTPVLNRFLKDNPSLSFDEMVKHLERFLAQLSAKKVRGYVPYETYSREYEAMEIELSNTLDKLRTEDKREELGHLAKDLAVAAATCGTQIRETIQLHYHAAFCYFERDDLSPLGIDGLLKDAAKRAVLESIQTMLDFLLDDYARAQTLHALAYIRRTLTKKGFELPPEPRLEGIEDPFSAGKEDYPEDKLVEIFLMFFIPQFLITLTEMQNEAKASNQREIQSMLLKSIKECVSEEEPNLKALTEEHHRVVEELRTRLNRNDNVKDQLCQQRPAWQNYQRAQTRLKEIDVQVNECYERLNTLHDEETELNAIREQKPEGLPQAGQSLKRKLTQYLQDAHGDQALEEGMAHERLQVMRAENKRIHALLNMLKREQQSHEQADHSPLDDILDLERHMQNLEQELAAETQKYILNSERIKESACETLGWVKSDETLCTPFITEAGFFALLKKFKYFVPAVEKLKAQTVPQPDIMDLEQD